MATKKQKREAAEAKRAAFDEEMRLSGLRVQAADHKRTETIRAKTQTIINEINDSRKKVLAENFIEMAQDYGKEVQQLTSEGLIAARTQSRADWLLFLHSLPEENRRAAVDAYYEQYCKGLTDEEAKRVSMVGRQLDLEPRIMPSLVDIDQARKFAETMFVGGFDEFLG